MSNPCCTDITITVNISQLDPERTQRSMNNWIKAIISDFEIVHVKLYRNRNIGSIHFRNRQDCIKFYNFYKNICLGLDGTMKVEPAANADGLLVEYPITQLPKEELEKKTLKARIRLHKAATRALEAELRELEYKSSLNFD